MDHGIIEATKAIVTMDVSHNGIIWGWIITINMWAKSIGTGIILVGAFLIYKYKHEDMPSLRWLMPLISFITLNIFLFFTLIDLHQPLRMIHIFTHPHWSSAITVGAWLASLFLILISIMMFTSFFTRFPDFRKNCAIAKAVRSANGLYEKIFPFTVFLALPVTMYTAIIMSQSAARELWVPGAELIQMLLAAFMAGTAVLILIADDWAESIKKDLAMILAFSVFLSFTMYMGEYFFSYKAAEVEATLAYIHVGGEYFTQFWAAMVLGYIIPFFVALRMNDNKIMMKFVAVTALIGLYLAKSTWLEIPQMIPLS